MRNAPEPEDDDAPVDWKEWLQTKRVELNAMTMPQIIEWLDEKMAEHDDVMAPHDGKLIPPEDVLEDELEWRLRSKIQEAVKERILREAGFERLVDAAVAAVERPDGDELIMGIRDLFALDRARPWRDHIETVAAELARAE